MAQICGEMTWLFDKLLKNVESDLEIWEMAKIIGKWLWYMVHGLSIWETAWLSWKCLKKLTNGKISGKWRIYFGIGLSVWETAKIFGEWRRSVGNVSNMWGNDLIIWQNILEMWKMT